MEKKSGWGGRRKGAGGDGRPLKHKKGTDRRQFNMRPPKGWTKRVNDLKRHFGFKHAAEVLVKLVEDAHVVYWTKPRVTTTPDTSTPSER